MDKLTKTECDTYKKLKRKIRTKNQSVQTDPTSNINVVLPDFFEKFQTYFADDDDDDCIESTKPAQSSLKRCYNKDDESYYKNLTKKKQKLIDNTEKEIFDMNHVNVPMRFKILESNIDMSLKSIAMNKVDQLSKMRTTDNEYFKLTSWIENLSKIPIGKYKPLPIDITKTPEDIKLFLDSTKEKLNSTVFGHEDAKNQLIRLLAKWISNPSADGLVIGLQGPPGTGKTLYASNIAKNLDIPMSFVSLGTCSCSTDLVGSNYVYEGSTYGRLSAELMKAKYMNPVLYFDELDKISPTKYGDEIVSTLIHLTDSTQNSKFHDRYFSDLEMDFSKSLIIFSYNDEDKINPILKDRMVTIRIKGYNNTEKAKICQKYMLPKIFKEYGFSETDIVFTDEVIKYIISFVDTEQGVRNLKRGLEEIVSQINLHKLLKNDINKKPVEFPITITTELVDKFIKKNEKSLAIPSMYM